MQYIKGIESYQNKKSTAITFGKFDGLHQGHNLLIQKVEEHQKNDDVDGVVVAGPCMWQKGIDIICCRISIGSLLSDRRQTWMMLSIPSVWHSLHT